MDNKPKYEHDCKHCIFITHHRGIDIYICKEAAPVTAVIARESDESSNYSSLALHLIKDMLENDCLTLSPEFREAYLVGLALCAIEKI